MEIRAFSNNDRSIFTRMHREFYSSPAVVHGITESQRQSLFEAVINGSPYLDGYIFWENTRAQGYALVARGYSTEAGGQSIWLEELYVTPEARGKGMGSQFLEFLFENYKDAKRFALEVSPQNRDVIRLYRRHGYEQSEYIQFIYDRDK